MAKAQPIAPSPETIRLQYGFNAMVGQVTILVTNLRGDGFPIQFSVEGTEQAIRELTEKLAELRRQMRGRQARSCPRCNSVNHIEKKYALDQCGLGVRCGFCGQVSASRAWRKTA